MKPREPTPRGFVENLWYEQVEMIMRTNPKRFFLFSPTTKRCFALYLDLKREAEAMKQAA
jgi:hypothetical protein